MKKIIRLALSCVWLPLGLLPAHAQTTVANFVANNTNGAAPLTVLFTNLSSTNATDYSWDFGDGNTSTAVNPTNSYSNPGSYTVTLTAIGSSETNVFSLTNYIIVTNPAVKAIFIANVAHGVAPLTVVFTNLSSGATNYSWDFGDGNTSTAANPTNIYTSAGSYNVSLTAIGPGGTNVFSLTNYITVNQPGATISVTNLLLSASFSFTAYVQNILAVQTNIAILTASPIKIATKDIINSIAVELGRGTNNLRDARLLLRISESPNGPATGFILRQGTNDTDISQYLQFQLPSQYRTVTTERSNAKAGTTNVVDYTIIQFLLNTSRGSFNVQGLLKLSSSSLLGKGHQVLSHNPLPLALRAELSGTGLAGGFSTAYRGTFTAGARKVEIRQIPAP